MQAQIDTQEMQLRDSARGSAREVKHQFRKEIEMIKAQAALGY